MGDKKMELNGMIAHFMQYLSQTGIPSSWGLNDMYKEMFFPRGAFYAMIYGKPTMRTAIDKMVQEATLCHDQPRDIEIK